MGTLLSNADEGDTGIIEDFDDGADEDRLKFLGFVRNAKLHVLLSRAGAVKVRFEDGSIQSLDRSQAETVLLEA